MNKLWNNHMHTCFSGDSNTPMADMIEASIKYDMAGITFTDHLDLDYYQNPGYFDLDFDGYKNCYDTLTDNGVYKASIEVLWGIELGLQPHLAEKHQEIISSYNFDYVIGSSHLVDGQDPYYTNIFANGLKRGVRRYFQSIIENINAYKNFDAYGHLDYILRYSNDAQKLPYEDYQDIIEEILNLLITNDKALEINTAAYKFGLKEPNPCIATIKKYKALGGKLITIGSDAHITDHIPIGYDTLATILKDCGFNSYYVYKKRQPIEYPID